MITIFTTAKPFAGRIRINQLNAIRSWKRLHSDVEVILFGSGQGYEEVVEKEGLVHHADVGTNERGTPLISSMFSLAERRGRHAVLAYVNCDIILTGDFVQAVQSVPKDRFLMVGQRWDMDIHEGIDFGDTGWQDRLREQVTYKGEQRPEYAIDYFVFTRGIWEGIPQMVVGRAGYDNWLIYHCRANGVPVVDASDTVMAVHQNHDYGHVAGGMDEVYSGAEARRNVELADGKDCLFTIVDAEWRLRPEGISRNFARGHWGRFFEVQLILGKDIPGGRYLLSLLRFLRGIYHQARRRPGA